MLSCNKYGPCNQHTHLHNSHPARGEVLWLGKSKRSGDLHSGSDMAFLIDITSINASYLGLREEKKGDMQQKLLQEVFMDILP